VRTVIRNARASRLIVLAVAALSAAAIAGCGGDDEEATVATTGPTGPTGPTGAAGQAQEIEVSETDFQLDPPDPTVKPGEVTITATNDSDTTVHSLEVEGPQGSEELQEDLQPGDSGELTVDLDEPGKYKWYCPIANHEQLGMVGDITVEE
jgi:plastocyanin